MAPGDYPWPFQYEDGSFVNSKGSFKACPTTDKSDLDEDTDRIYVKLRSKNLVYLTTGGGLTDPGWGVIFILKTKLDQLAWLRHEDDPARETLDAEDEAAQWKSDERFQSPDVRHSIPLQ